MPVEIAQRLDPAVADVAYWQTVPESKQQSIVLTAEDRSWRRSVVQRVRVAEPCNALNSNTASLTCLDR